MSRSTLLAGVTAVAAAAVLASIASGGPTALATYRVTLVNLTGGQPFSPPVAATHARGLHMFQVGQLATDELAAIAQDGDELPMAALFKASPHVTEVVDVARPLTTHGKVVGSFTDTAVFEIHAAPNDRLSLATMLICTNDGFLGLDAVRLPGSSAKTFELNGYDAGREDNTEQSVDLVDPCSALGPFPLPGDPDGNEDAAVATHPVQPIAMHSGISGAGELSPAQHGWQDPVAHVRVERIA
jgi:hypothetical protein